MRRWRRQRENLLVFKVPLALQGQGYTGRGIGWKEKQLGLFISPVLSKGLQGPFPGPFLTPKLTHTFQLFLGGSCCCGVRGAEVNKGE